MPEAATKQCRECKENIPVNAKKCAKCGAKQGNWVVRHPIWTVIIVIFILIGISGASSSNSSKTDVKQSTAASSQHEQEPATAETPESQAEVIEYTQVNKDELDTDLETNAAAAKDKWNKKYVEVTGNLSTIDSDLKYITIESSTKSFDLKTVHCTVKNNDQKEKIKTLTKGQSITVRGQITDVGEVMGYSLNMVEIL